MATTNKIVKFICLENKYLYCNGIQFVNGKYETSKKAEIEYLQTVEGVYIDK